jgi:signal transduction histidine kinase
MIRYLIAPISKHGDKLWDRFAGYIPTTSIPSPPEEKPVSSHSILWGYFPVVLVTAAGLIISIGLFMQSLNWEERKVEIAFDETAQDRILLVHREIKFSLGIIQDIASFIDASETVGRTEFRKFVGPPLKNQAGIKALAWIPKVDSNKLDRFVATAKKSFPPFQVKEQSPNGDLSVARARPVYYPVLYVQPYQDNKAMLGLNIGIDSQITALFQQSINEMSTQIATKTIDAPQKLPVTGLTVVVPVFFKPDPDQKTTEVGLLRGYALGIFYLGEIVERALDNLRPGSVDIHFYQEEQGAEGSHLYTHFSRIRNKHSTSDRDYVNTDMTYTQQISIANQTWNIVCQPASDRFEPETRTSWLIFIGGIAFTALLTIYTANLVGRTNKIRLVVAERTAQLRSTVEELNQEVIERKAAETELQTLNETLENHIAYRTAEAERRTEYLEQFAYVASHDLKAPLRAVSNLAEWIEEDLRDKLDTSSKEQLALLRDRVRRMHELIEGLLEYSRVGKTSDIETQVDTRELIHEIVDSLSPPKGFVIKIKGDMPVLVADRLQLGQVFSNLIGNSLKHHGGKKGKIHIGCEETGGLYQFTISDNGRGIAPEYHDKVFKMFQTLESRDYANSTGIGLALVKKIVVEHGGSIQLKSNVGEGASFTFTWPRKGTGK